MLTDMPVLNHLQQQQAVERIQELMAAGMSSGEAIRLVSSEIRATHTGERVSINVEDDDDESPRQSARGAADSEQDWDDEDGGA